MLARPLAVAVTLALVSGACGGDDDSVAPAEVPMAPQFAPETSAAPEGAPETSTTAGSAAAVPAATESSSSTPGPGTGAAASERRASVADPRGDVTPALADSAPAWADLTGADLRSTAGAYELRVALGGAAPSQAPEGRTMNVALFADTDGDGGIDYEVWANLGPEGWGGSWYDNRAGTVRFVDDSGVTVTTEGAALVRRFPASHLGSASSFRWSVASEWGRYEAIGTIAAARDDAPDGDAPTGFPG